MTKLNAAGTALSYSTHIGGANMDIGMGVALDPAGNVYVTGVTGSAEFPVTPGAFQRTAGPADGSGNRAGDCFVAKLNPAGNALLYSTYLGGAGDEACTAIAVDGAGKPYVTGTTTSGNFPVTANAWRRGFTTGAVSPSS